MITRRALTAVGLLALSPLARPALAASGGPRLDPPEPMDFERLKGLARTLRDRPYAPPPEAPASPALDALTYGPLQEIRYPPAHALFPESPYPVTFFHLGNFFRHPVKIFSLEGGQARQVLYSRDLFAYPPGNPGTNLPDGSGFAGVRFQKVPADQPGADGDWLAFLGASYFRAAGDGAQYGASARGIAIDTAPGPGKTEEFPVFTRFYVSPASDGAVTILALLEGQSLTGAYRFTARKEPHVVIDVACTLYIRKAVERFGVAPLTSMLWYSEGMSRFLASDWRPEVHDSDGLLMQTGAGELIWRPLNNPPRLSVSAFADKSPKGFGLLQRDRAFDTYIDDGFEENRPHIWVEPQGDWGAGSVQLVEIPTHQETDDNIGAMWVPSDPPGAGAERSFAYRLHWPVTEPVATNLARCVATRATKASWLSEADRRPGRANLVRQFVLEFEGAALAGLDPEKALVALTLSRGSAEEVGATWAPYGKPSPWRVFLKIFADGPEPVEMRLKLKSGDRLLSETWAYQYYPEAPGTVL
ncbi:glucan biosynthesis protein [Methylobacterium pseudosasicola]|uniref:Glucans biosynthesis protein n=1 Tax=Methylobacterium pseudosasicola TaxID=582667 RepID=A0A1I4M1V6_9HYPH|nr:glucan biosynthesis protein [Methylobacterium pseudosasicola]SFL96967.1 glucans biosynthesis protein [Methylobacterium pseudosasicola]